jgi:hypothetical protein
MAGESPLNGEVPWWVRFIYTFGIPAALSVYLIWLLAARIEGKLDAQTEQLRVHQGDTTFNKAAAENSAKRLEEIYNILQRICVNGAATQADRNACFDLTRREP